MKDSLVVEVFEARNDLFEVVTYFRVCQGVSCFPNMCQGLQQRKYTVNLIPSPDAFIGIGKYLIYYQQHI